MNVALCTFFCVERHIHAQAQLCSQLQSGTNALGDVVGGQERLGHGPWILLVDRDRLVHRDDGRSGQQRVDLVDDVHELLAAELVELLGVDDQGSCSFGK